MNLRCMHHSANLNIGRCDHESDVFVIVRDDDDKVTQWTFCKFHLHYVIGNIVERHVNDTVTIQPIR